MEGNRGIAHEADYLRKKHVKTLALGVAPLIATVAVFFLVLYIDAGGPGAAVGIKGPENSLSIVLMSLGVSYGVFLLFYKSDRQIAIKIVLMLFIGTSIYIGYAAMVMTIYAYVESFGVAKILIVCSLLLLALASVGGYYYRHYRNTR